METVYVQYERLLSVPVILRSVPGDAFEVEVSRKRYEKRALISIHVYFHLSSSSKP